MMTELSRMLLVSNGNATAVVDRLIKDGLVRRQVPESDRRSVQVVLTPKGTKKFELLAKDHEHQIAQQFAEIKDADVEAIITVLKRLRHGDKQ
jgi:DNA-binding MarR family transcriptional regulator